MPPQTDLDSQQIHLTSVDYDLRITNLARFIYSKVQSEKSKLQSDTLNLIDIGAGSGLMMKYFMSKGIEAAGIELDQTLVDASKKDRALKGKITQGDITHVRGNQDYDIVVSADVIEHIEDDQKAVKNLWSFVKPGGLMIIAVPAHPFLYSQRDRNWGHYRRYSKELLRRTVEKALSEEKYEMRFSTFWNFIGFWTYLLFVKLIHLDFHEKMRYEKKKKTGIVTKLIDAVLQLEANIGGSPLGLTLVMGVRKKK